MAESLLLDTCALGGLGQAAAPARAAPLLWHSNGLGQAELLTLSPSHPCCLAGGGCGIIQI